VLLLALVVAGCSEKKKAPPKSEQPFAPKAEKLTLASAYESSLTEEILRDYLQDRPEVEVNTHPLAPADLAKRIEKGEEAADVVIGLPRAEMQPLAQAQALRPPQQPLCADVPPEYREAAGAWVGLTISALAIGANEQVSRRKQISTPRHWSDLTRPKYRGWIVIARPPISRAAQLLIAGITSYMHPKGWDFWKRLDKNLFQYAATEAAPAELMARGDTMIALDIDHRLIAQKRKGKKISIHYPSPTFYEVEVGALLKKGSHPEAAERFLRWLCGDRGMHVLEKYRAGVTKPFVDPSESWKTRMSQIKLYSSTAALDLEKSLEEWRRRFGN
jgi:iron(III) transport system substrate-binding protein